MFPSFKNKLIRSWTSWLKPGPRFHRLQVLETRSSLGGSRRVCFIFFSFLKLMFSYVWTFFLDFCFVIFYGLLSIELVLNSWLEPSVSKLAIILVLPMVHKTSSSFIQFQAITLQSFPLTIDWGSQAYLILFKHSPGQVLDHRVRWINLS